MQPRAPDSSEGDAVQARLRQLPSVDELLKRPSLEVAFAGLIHALRVEACRAALEVARGRLRSGGPTLSDGDVLSALERQRTPNLRRVLNATGVILHTNLGRAPLAARAVERVGQVARGYCNLELDLQDGERGHRGDAVEQALRSLTGAEAALVVNNCAAAVLLALSALGSGRSAIVSRGELVEIGGGFRMPDVMRQSGVTLVEVGTTNRTRLSDYQAAIDAQTALLVKVHPSNFAMQGFTEAVSVAELSALGKERGLPVFYDLGSGALEALVAEGVGSEPTVARSVAAGADLVAFSGDKLLGGPQVGVLVGKAAIVERLAKHPLMRALRIDKMTVAALEATLELYREGLADDAVPIRALARQPVMTLQARAHRLAAMIAPGLRPRVVESTATVGGGSMPTSQLPSVAVALSTPDARRLHERLRLGVPAVVGRLNEGEVWLDVRCLDEADVELAAATVSTAAGEMNQW